MYQNAKWLPASRPDTSHSPACKQCATSKPALLHTSILFHSSPSTDCRPRPRPPAATIVGHTTTLGRRFWSIFCWPAAKQETEIGLQVEVCGSRYCFSVARPPSFFSRSFRKLRKPTRIGEQEEKRHRYHRPCPPSFVPFPFGEYICVVYVSAICWQEK